MQASRIVSLIHIEPATTSYRKNKTHSTRRDVNVGKFCLLLAITSPLAQTKSVYTIVLLSSSFLPAELHEEKRE